MLKAVRRYAEGGFVGLTPRRAQEVARSLVSGERGEQVARVARELMEWSQRARGRLTEIIRREMGRQLAALGVATREDLDALGKRVRDLERATGGPARKSPAKKRAAKKPAS